MSLVHCPLLIYSKTKQEVEKHHEHMEHTLKMVDVQIRKRLYTVYAHIFL